MFLRNGNTRRVSARMALGEGARQLRGAADIKPGQVDGVLHIDHATVATSGQVSINWDAGLGKELCLHYQLEQLKALAAAS